MTLKRRFRDVVQCRSGIEVGTLDTPIPVINGAGVLQHPQLAELVSGDATTLHTHTALALPVHEHELENGTPANNVKATGTITFTGVVNDRQTVTIGDEVYEFSTDGEANAEGAVPVDISASTKVNATTILTLDGVVKDGDLLSVGGSLIEIDTDGVYTEGRLPVDLSAAGSAMAAVGTLTFTGAVNDGEIVTIGADVYEFTTDGVVESGRIAVNVAGDTSAPVAVASLVIASGFAGTENVTLTNGAGDTVVVTHNVKGTIGNAIGTTTNCALASFGDDTLVTGADPTAADAIGPIVAVLDPLANFTAAVGDPSTIVITAVGDFAGSLGNLLATTTTCADASFTAGTFAGGSDATNIEAAAALATSIEANSDIVNAVQGIDANTNKVIVTAALAGAAGNDIATTTTCTNGAFGADALSGGSTGTAGIEGEIKYDANFIYVCVDVTDGIATWKKSALS